MLAITQEDTPYICSPCLGSAHPRLVRDSTGIACRICQKPFITYHWKSNKRSRATLICKQCAESQEACQSCIKDIKYHIDLPIKTAALRILAEEGGTDASKDDVLRAVAEKFNQPADSIANESNDLTTLKAIIARLRVPDEIKQDGKHHTLCIYGIEEDLDISALRSYLNASIEQIESVPRGRYAFISFSTQQEPPNVPKSAIIDGRRLVFAWGERVGVPYSLQPKVGAVIRAYLRTLTE